MPWRLIMRNNTRRLLAVVSLGIIAGHSAPVDAGAPAVCCFGSDCALLEQNQCEAQGGYFVGAASCDSLCDFGACCLPGPECREDDGVGGRMDEAFCDELGGQYFGGAGCGPANPCDPSGPPEGYEVVEVSLPEFSHRSHFWPRINECGQVVFGLNRTQNTPSVPGSCSMTMDRWST